MIRIRELPASDQPAYRLRAVGPAALSDTELLAALIKPDALDTAATLLSTLGWRGMMRASLADLDGFPGIGPSRAVQVHAALEIARRVLLETAADERHQIRSPADVARLLMLEMGALDQEHFRVVCLDTKNRVQRISTVYIGNLNTAAIRVCEVFKEAVRLNSAAIVACHNHPSGQCDPSPEDILVTRQIVEAGKLLDIETLDHLIIGGGRWVSLRERGLGFPS